MPKPEKFHVDRFAVVEQTMSDEPDKTDDDRKAIEDLAQQKCSCKEKDQPCRHQLSNALLATTDKLNRAMDGLQKSMAQSKRAVTTAERNWASLVFLRNAVRTLRSHPSDHPTDAVWVNAKYKEVPAESDDAAFFLSPRALAERAVDELLKG